MSEKFAKKWGESYDKTPLTSKIKEAVRPPGPLKPRLDLAIRGIDLQIQKLDKATNRFTERDRYVTWVFTEYESVSYFDNDLMRGDIGDSLL